MAERERAPPLPLTLPLPATLMELLEELESQSPTLSALPPPGGSTSWGTYFLDGPDEDEASVEDEALGESRRDLRLRIMTAIGNCRSLRVIDLNPLGKRGMYSVRDVEAKALLNGLKRSNPALERLDLLYFEGFGTPEACKALAAAVVRPSSSRLKLLDMRGLELSVEGVGQISAALRDNSASLLRELYLDDNDMIGSAAGARHIAAILTHSPALRVLGLCEIGMDDEGAVVIADAVACTTTLDRLDIGYHRKNPEQAAMLNPLLTALTRDAASSSSAAASFNESITHLWLEIRGPPGGKDSAAEDGLAEALAAMLASNTTLEFLRVSSFFVTRGLWALAHNSSIMELQLVHRHSLHEEALDPLLLSILQECTKVQVLRLIFHQPYGPSNFTMELFQGLKHNNPGVKRLVLDGWDGLDDDMFQDLIQSLSTNTSLNHISITGSSWETQGKGERLVTALRDTRMKLLPPRLLELLAELESESPSLQELPSADLWGSYFDCRCQDPDRECQHRGEWEWEVRLRLLTAIGRCSTLRKIDLMAAGYGSVRQVEALALLSGLQDNLVLQHLDLGGYLGFGTRAACCQALGALIGRSYGSLDYLNLQDLGLSAEGVGDIAAALGRNARSKLTILVLDGNDIGNAVGAQHLAHILTNLPSLRGLGITSIGMKEEGAVVIAQALAHTTTLNLLKMGERKLQNPRQSAFMVPLLQALMWPGSDTSHDSESGLIKEEEEDDDLDYYDFWSGLKKWSERSKHTFMDATTYTGAAMSSSGTYASPGPAFFNRSITQLVLECPGGQEGVEPGLGEAVARVLQSNRALYKLSLSSFFVRRGLGGLRESSSITKLLVNHLLHSDDDDMDPVLITILEECTTVKELQLDFRKPFVSSQFTKALFRGLQNNRSIKRLVLDGWAGLDDHMFHDLMMSLRHNSNNVLEEISIKGTSWEREGKGKHIQNALVQNKNIRTTSSAGLQQGSSSEEVPPQVMATMATAAAAAVIAVPVCEDPELLALLAQLESPSPTLRSLPRVEAFGHLFKTEVGHPKAELELRLRLMTAIGKCSTLTCIQFLEHSTYTHGIYRVTAAEATALLEGLKSNRVVEELDVSGYDGFGTGEVCTALAATLRSSRTLQFLNMGFTGMTAHGLGSIAAALLQNRKTVLRGLYLHGNRSLGQGAGAGHLADILTSALSLRLLGIWDTGMDDAGAVLIGNTLAQNTTLDTVGIGFGASNPEQAGITATLLARAFAPGLQDAEQEPQGVASKPPSANESVTTLRLGVWGAGEEPVSAALGEAVARMLRLNMTLKHLEISSCFTSRGLEGLCDNSSITRVTVRHGDSSDSEDYCKLIPILQRCRKVESLKLEQVMLTTGSCNVSKTFFQSLQDNPHLKEVILDDWQGLDDDMFHGLMQALHVNTNLERVSFENTVWKRQGKSAAVDEVIRQNKEYRRALAGVPTMPVKSCRLVLCGFSYAGKTTILNTLMKIEGSYFEGAGEIISAGIPRTRGFEVKVVKETPALRITVWDLAGHKEYHALHDFVFPNVNNSSLFLFVYNPFKLKANGEIEDLRHRKDFRAEFIYWLKFIASNSQLTQQVKPYVHVVVTFSDKIEGARYSIGIYEEMVAVKNKFKNMVEIPNEPTFINGQSRDEVYTLRRNMEGKLHQLVAKLPPIPHICEQTRTYVQRWAALQQGMPIISIDKFIELFQDTCKMALEDSLISEDYKRFLMDFSVKDDSWKVVASYLKDSGEVIYFQKLDLMVVDLQWLGMGVFGELVNIFGQPHHGRDRLELQNGFVSQNGLRQLLKISLERVGLDMTIVSEAQFFKLILELHLCFESKVEEGEVHYFIPICAYGEEDILGVDRQLTWPSHGDNHDYIFMGMRLQCADQNCTFLTPGFFPRLQVLFYNYDSKHKSSIGGRTKLQPNSILISVEFLDVFIELNAKIGCHIDVLVRSTESYLRSQSFVHEHIISRIRSFCASYEGCLGVTLVEGVLRCECVELLTLSRYRNNQYILADELITKVRAVKEKGYAYYTQSWEDIADNAEGKPSILKANKEYASVIDGHIILGRKEYLAKAEAEFQECKSNSSFSGESSTVQLSPQVKAAVQQVPHIAGRYANDSVEGGQRRGLAMILSMEADRPGGAVDRGRLEALLKTLKFDTEIVVDDSEEIKTRLKQVVKLPDLARDDCFLCCINAHGGTEEDGRQYILMSGTGQEKLYVVDDILKPITECTYLAKKPKVFVINACRGTGSLVASKKDEGSDVEGSQVVGKTAGQVRPLHSVSDCLVVFSTSHGEKSFRDPQEGTNFITALMDAIVEAQTADVLSILTSMIGKVTEMEVWDGPEKKFQCPELYSTLTQGLYWS